MKPLTITRLTIFLLIYVGLYYVFSFLEFVAGFIHYERPANQRVVYLSSVDQRVGLGQGAGIS